MPTSGVPSGTDTGGLRGDVGAEAHPVERYAAERLVGPVPRVRNRLSEPGDRKHAAAVRDERPAPARRSGVEDERPGRLGLGDAGDRGSDVALLGIAAAAATTVTAASSRNVGSTPASSPPRGRRDGVEEVGGQPRHHDLRLRVAEAAVELEHAGPFEVSISPAYRRPTNGVPRRASSSTTGR